MKRLTALLMILAMALMFSAAHSTEVYAQKWEKIFNKNYNKFRFKCEDILDGLYKSQDYLDEGDWDKAVANRDKVYKEYDKCLEPKNIEKLIKKKFQKVNEKILKKREKGQDKCIASGKKCDDKCTKKFKKAKKKGKDPKWLKCSKACSQKVTSCIKKSDAKIPLITDL